jgi:hypothetical protein
VDRRPCRNPRGRIRAAMAARAVRRSNVEALLHRLSFAVGGKLRRSLNEAKAAPQENAPQRHFSDGHFYLQLAFPVRLEEPNVLTRTIGCT